MQITYALLFGGMLLASTALTLPNPLLNPVPLTSGPSSQPGCRCDGWDHGNDDIRCYLTAWTPELGHEWGGQAGDFFCATYNDDKADDPNMDMWYTCPAARNNGIAKNCEPCAQSGAAGSTTLCRGNPTCFKNQYNGWTGGSSLTPQRCEDFSKDPHMCPMISEKDMERGRQWWECGKEPTP